MNLNEIPKLRIGDLKASLPIVQVGMGVGISLSGLALVVANPRWHWGYCDGRYW
jgi:NAD(P)H-dependent flavin oxidoreductase YrpB (nitropropane dioxygenase family)